MSRARSTARSGKAALAASFVATFATGCDSKATAPPIAPTVDVGTAPASSAVPAAASAAPVTSSPETPAATVAAPSPPPAPSFGHVTRREDGTCMWYADVQCPHAANGRIIPCNPPPPRRVQCADDAGH